METIQECALILMKAMETFLFDHIFLHSEIYIDGHVLHFI